MDEKKELIFACLFELRQCAECTQNLQLLDDVTHAENVAMQEILGIDLRGEPLDYDQLWSIACHELIDNGSYLAHQPTFH